MNKKYHEKFKILDILAVTTQAREGIETRLLPALSFIADIVTTQAREGIETSSLCVCNISVMREHPVPVPGKKV